MGRFKLLRKGLQPSADCWLWRGGKDAGAKISQANENFLILTLDYYFASQFPCVCISLFLYERKIDWNHLKSDRESVNASFSVSVVEQVSLDLHVLYQLKVSKQASATAPQLQ